MDTSCVIHLIKEIYTADTIGEMIPVETSVKRFARVTSVSRDEFFAAGTAGFKPSFRFTMNRHEYDGEKVLAYNGRKYQIYRTYAGAGDGIDLYVEERTGV